MIRTLPASLAFILFSPMWACGQCPKKATKCVTVIRHARNETAASVVSDNRSQAVMSATTNVLNFFLIEAPELQRAYNERINRAEGLFTPLYENLDLLTTIPVPRQPSTGLIPTMGIKHHQLGETWSQFLMASPLLAANVQRCAQQKRPAPNTKRTKFLPCSTVWPLIDSTNGSSTFDCLSTGRIAGKDMLCRDLDGEVTFVEGKLESFKIAIADDWPNVYNELCERFGAPTAADENGAFAIWDTSDLHLMASNSEDVVGVSWMDEKHLKSTMDWASKMLESQNQFSNGNSLDQ